MTAREEILSRIRTALPGDSLDPAASYGSIQRPFCRVGTLNAHATLDLFIDRLLDYDTAIVQLRDDSEIAQAISQVLTDSNETEILAAAEFPVSWLPGPPFITTLDRNLSVDEIDRAEAVLTTCEVAVASTGTIILVHGGAQGRRMITLLPDHHICLVRRDQILELVPEALAAIASQSTRPITTISGPSATSDIEMTRIRGVHGPRRLTVILYGPLS